MISPSDLLQCKARGIEPDVIEQQIKNFTSGFPYLPLAGAATLNHGIISLSSADLDRFIEVYNNSISKGVSVLKFVPASGAASRMFKALFEALESLESGTSEKTLIEQSAEIRAFYEGIEKFSFFPRLMEVSGGKTDLLSLVKALLNSEGLNYGNMPKGLLLFHTYEAGARTAFEEHLVEGAHYARNNDGIVHLHFTVSPEHQPAFEAQVSKSAKFYSDLFGVDYHISFSQQKPSTDTIAVDAENQPYRDKDGTLLFRPAGHGALLDNLNDLNSDIVFIKNIDNVVPDRLKETTFTYKKALAGVLLHYQQKIFEYQSMLNDRHYASLDSAQLASAANFLENELNTRPVSNQYYTEKEDLYIYLREKYNRPIRVCGMVKNEGEPGGGPFWAMNQDGTISLQIAESAQIDPSDPQQQSIAAGATHFNPVDLVCGLKNYRGEKFHLPDFRDPKTGFISKKSKDGRELKAMELPGLWNGAMSDWITLFAEVPADTFNPVKTVNDLLRPQHQ